MEKVIRRAISTFIDYFVWSVIIVVLSVLIVVVTNISIDNIFLLRSWIIGYLICQYVSDTLFKGVTIGRIAMRIKVSSNATMLYKTLHSPLKIMPLILYPYVIYKMCKDREIPYDKFLNIRVKSTDFHFSADLILRRIAAELITLIPVIPLSMFCTFIVVVATNSSCPICHPHSPSEGLLAAHWILQTLHIPKVGHFGRLGLCRNNR